MGLMDNLRAQANSLAQQANAGIAKLDNLPVQRRSDALLRSLGVAVLADRTGRGNPGTGAEIDRLITEITQHEAQNGLNIVQQATQAAAQAQARSPMGPMGQMGQAPGSYMPGSPPAPSPNVAGSMPGAGAGYVAGSMPGAGAGYVAGSMPGAGAGYGASSGPDFGGPGSPGGSGDPGASEPAGQQDQPEFPA